MQDIRKLSLEELNTWVHSVGEPGFRARQIYDWLWVKCARKFDDMTNLPKKLRAHLEESFSLKGLEISKKQVSRDGTIKLGFELPDGNMVEGVLIPAGKRMTACISSQVGCSLNCTFCATGYLPRVRNLEFYEIFDQVAVIRQLAEEEYGQSLSNIVLMGMGEPLLNYSNVLKAMERISDPGSLGMSPQRITLSTAGIAKMIRKLGDDGVRFNLALSLHASSNEKRSRIMPINESNTLEDLVDALNYFYERTHSRITLEYCVIEGVNDSDEDIRELTQFARKITCKINLIEYNPIDMATFRSSKAIEDFGAKLEKNRLIVNIRRSRGKDIDAACGQLANKNAN
ncbi:MAG: 23S rRNA (adenine(2503)-C(2))-methyltransferase RlmN [Flavobacteriales bacterium]|nr:23S rRNA (adenine(2503)-C(2))-methyltransferase RlmN [Flavobacteriales bacterium]